MRFHERIEDESSINLVGPPRWSFEIYAPIFSQTIPYSELLDQLLNSKLVPEDWQELFHRSSGEALSSCSNQG